MLSVDAAMNLDEERRDLDYVLLTPKSENSAQ